MNEVVKLTVNLTPEAATVLKYLAAKQGTSATNVINRAIALAEFVWAEKEKGNRIQVEAKNGDIREVVFKY